MPDLADFIGQLTASVTRARLQGDLEAVRVAELYASHQYLRHFPVPRFRLPTVEINIPMVIEDMEESPPEKSPPAKLNAKEIEEEVAATLDFQLQKHDVDITPKELTQLRKALAETIRKFEQTDEVAVDIGEISKFITREVIEQLKRIPKLKDVAVEAWTGDISKSLKIRLLNRRKIPPRIKVLVKTAQVKEAGADDVLVRLKLSITEDAIEWTVMEIEGKEVERLIPE